MNDSSPAVFESERLYAREFRRGDEDAFAAVLNAPETRPCAPDFPEGLAGAALYVEACLARSIETPRRVYELALCLKETDELIGTVRLGLTDDRRQGELGYLIGPDRRGRGYAAEAATACMRFGFLGLDLHRIYASCDEKNEASARVLEKLGMRRDGHSIKSLRYIKRGTELWHGQYHYALTLKEYLMRLPDGAYSPTGGH